MGEYFKPWQRKIGVVALLMACVFAAGWVRSGTVEDFVHLELLKHKICLELRRGQILLLAWAVQFGKVGETAFYQWSTPVLLPKVAIANAGNDVIERELPLCGLIDPSRTKAEFKAKFDAILSCRKFGNDSVTPTIVRITVTYCLLTFSLLAASTFLLLTGAKKRFRSR